MDVCLACSELTGRGPVCRSCSRRLARVPDQAIAGGMVVRAAFAHRGAARSLVHRLKYHGVRRAGWFLAERMALLVPPGTAVLVPVPRAAVRRIRYGVDPAADLADAVGRITGIPVVRVIRAALWWPRHAIREPAGRSAPRFHRGTGAVPPHGVVLVDDVLTSGSTLRAAADAVGGDVRQGLVATSPGTMARPATEAGEAMWR